MTRRLPYLQASSSPYKSLLSVLVATLFGGSALAQQGRPVDRLQEEEAPTVVEGEILSGRPDREVRVQRDVEITRGTTVVNADDINYDIVDDSIDAEGNVRMLRAGNRFSGNWLKLKLDTGVGDMDSPVYRLLRRNAQGYAERIDFEGEDVATIVRGVYTTCEGPDPDWYLKVSKLTLDDGAGTGYARNAVLVFKGVPIGGTPAISFPLSEQRKSGFLAPTIASSSNSGLQLTTPYYLDIAPNRDLTLYPRYMARRGLMLGADARYLERDFAGETKLEFMNDSERNGDTRYALSVRHNQRLSPDTALAVDYNRVSDNEYLTDFPLSHVFYRHGGYLNRRLLAESAMISYAPSSPWSGSIRFSDFQVLQDPNAPIRIPHARLPQISLNYDQYNDSGLSLNVATQYTRFVHSTYEQGDRLVVNPRLSYNYLQGPGYFVRPSVSLHGTVYNLDRASPGMTAPSRFLPTVSLDSGLVFERASSWFGPDSVQTLEPRAFYTYTPYVQQNGNLYPNFDTTIADISYAQLFRENRFVGNDRIGDTNELTLATTSRYLESNGVERLRLAIAQRFNFTQPKVGLGATLAETSDTKSDVLLLASGRVTHDTRLDANFQYNQAAGEVNRMNLGVFWQPGPMKVINAQYRRDSRDLPPDVFPNTKYEVIDISGQWPIAQRWYGVGRINYLIDQNRIGQSLFGIEHQADCWIFRAVAQRLPTAAGVVNTTIFFQLEFNGLSMLGMNPMRALRANVPGYQPLTQPQ